MHIKIKYTMKLRISFLRAFVLIIWIWDINLNDETIWSEFSCICCTDWFTFTWADRGVRCQMQMRESMYVAFWLVVLGESLAVIYSCIRWWCRRRTKFLHFTEGWWIYFPFSPAQDSWFGRFVWGFDWVFCRDGVVVPADLFSVWVVCFCASRLLFDGWYLQ